MDGKAHFDFTGRTVFITGGGTGIGAGIAETFARANAEVVIAGRRRAPLEAIASRFPERISYVQMDLCKDEDRRRALGAVIDRHGRLDVLVNNSGGATLGLFINNTAEQVAEMFAVNLEGPTYLTQLAFPHLKETKGCVVNISSVAGRAVPHPHRVSAVYSAAKAGINQLTRALAGEFAPHGVRVNAVSPGPTANEKTTKAAAKNPAYLDRWIEMTPMGRYGQPPDIASVVAFMASDAAGWVTGQIIDSSGGWNISP